MNNIYDLPSVGPNCTIDWVQLQFKPYDETLLTSLQSWGRQVKIPRNLYTDLPCSLDSTFILKTEAGISLDRMTFPSTSTVPCAARPRSITILQNPGSSSPPNLTP